MDGAYQRTAPILRHDLKHPKTQYDAHQNPLAYMDAHTITFFVLTQSQGFTALIGNQGEQIGKGRHVRE